MALPNDDRRKLDYAGPPEFDYNASGDRFNPGCLIIFVAAVALIATVIVCLELGQR